MSSQQQRVRRLAPEGRNPLHAVVGSIEQGRRGLYVVAYPRHYDGTDLTEETSITFPLKKWTGDENPRKGQMVRLDTVQLFERGWRASRGHPITPGSSIQQ